MLINANRERNLKLSVCIITYNHKNYIKDCLDSIIPQVKDFEAEIVIGDDFSTDGTRDVLVEYKNRYPEIINLIFQKENTGGTQNYCDVHSKATGDYVAQIDGDDFILPGKFKAQTSILEQNPEVSFCVHGLKVLNSTETMGMSESLPVMGSIQDLLRFHCYFGSSSVMYRRVNECELPIQGKKNIVDFAFHLQRARFGKIFLDKQLYGVYRKHSRGISKTKSYAEIVQLCYEDAFDYAIEVGVDKKLVNQSRLLKRLNFAVNCYFDENKTLYRKYITLNKCDYRLASFFHKLLSRYAFVPYLPIIFILKNFMCNKFRRSLDFTKRKILFFFVNR